MTPEGWREVPFSEAVQINPAVRLGRGSVYPFGRYGFGECRFEKR